jgi:hypothetical protein
MKINCSFSELVEIHKLVPNPKNPNKHPQEQIEMLKKQLDFQGQRHPIIVSKRSGFVVAGHGRLEAMKALGVEKVAVNYQDFENEAQEYAFIVADNGTAAWSELDLSAINQDMIAFGPDFDVDMLGIKGFEIDVVDRPDYGDKNVEFDADAFGSDLQHTCPSCGFEFND